MTFELTKEQSEKADEWIEERLKIKFDPGTIGGRFEYCFIPTGLGTIVVLKDLAGSEINLTDFNDW